ncbi:MAG: hypothetical protein WBA22_14550 [Candidatus Methanofastidiosia archaeon]
MRARASEGIQPATGSYLEKRKGSRRGEGWTSCTHLDRVTNDLQC